MNEEIFRKKSLEKVKSPENLDDYIQVSNPGVWLLLISIIVLLVGACVWGIFGHIDRTVATNVHAERGAVVCYITEQELPKVQEGMVVKFQGMEAVIIEKGSKEDMGYACELQSDQEIPDGVYEGKIVIKSVRPFSFILN
ncbi:MAG: hypothetical protein MJ086_02125 [Lachnospiraceae bacterium]|nr:hypothetical protein [Lachnospiraceae bacterium]